jgi:hypothetical protein
MPGEGKNIIGNGYKYMANDKWFVFCNTARSENRNPRAATIPAKAKVPSGTKEWQPRP